MSELAKVTLFLPLVALLVALLVAPLVALFVALLLSQVTQASVRNFHLLWEVVHLSMPGSTFHLKVVQIYGPCRWIHHRESEGK